MNDFISDEFQETLDGLLSDLLPSLATPTHSTLQENSASRKKGDKTAGVRARRYRERKKQAFDEEVRENKRLKAECLELVETIESLENELQTGQGGYMFRHLDLKAENDAVRQELKGYEAFVSEIVQLALRPLPAHAQSSSLRYQHSALNSLQIKEFICQTVGLAQSSLNGNAWQSKPGVKLRNGMQANVRFQYLPTGCTGKRAKRLNLRVDVPGLCCNVDELFKIVKHRSFDEVYRQNMCRRIHDTKAVQVTQVQAAQVDAGNKIAFKQLRMTSGTSHYVEIIMESTCVDSCNIQDEVDAEQLVGCANEIVPVDARAFDLVNVEQGTVDAKVIVSAGGGSMESCGDECHEKEHRISFENSCFGGILFRRSSDDDERCDLCFIRSLPFNSPCLGGARTADRIRKQLECFGANTPLTVFEPFVQVLLDLNQLLAMDT